jgi:hypothetical protein
MFRLIVKSVNGARYLTGSGGTRTLPAGETAPAGEGTTFATMANVRGYVTRELNSISSYYRVEVIDADGVVVGTGVRAGRNGTGKQWRWDGAASVQH